MFNRTEIRDALMRVRGTAPVYLIDELVEQLVLAHREHEAPPTPYAECVILLPKTVV